MAPLIAALLAQLAANPAQLVLGSDAGAELSLRAPSAAKVSFSASVGAVSDVRRDGRDVRARYQPPKLKSPAVALILAQIDDGDDRELQWLALPLSGSDTMVIETRPESSVEIDVAGRKFGPVTADQKGMASLRLVVPPGVRQGTLHITDKLGNTNQRPLDLEPPPFPRLRIAPRGDAASQSSPVELEIFAVRPDGSPDDSARLELHVAEGDAKVVERIGHGVYLARYQPARGRTSGAVRVEANAGEQLASAQVQVRGGEIRGGQWQKWPSSLQFQRPWSFSLGAVGGGGATFHGSTVGTILFEAALRLESLPAELLLDLGPGFFTSVSQPGLGGAIVQAQPEARIVQLGVRASRQIAQSLDAHGALGFGMQQQTISIPGQPSQDSWSPRITLAGGANLWLGPGRALAQLQLDLVPSNPAGLRSGLSGVQVLAGYLLTLR